MELLIGGMQEKDMLEFWKGRLAIDVGLDWLAATLQLEQGLLEEAPNQRKSSVDRLNSCGYPAQRRHHDFKYNRPLNMVFRILLGGEDTFLQVGSGID